MRDFAGGLEEALPIQDPRKLVCPQHSTWVAGIEAWWFAPSEVFERSVWRLYVPDLRCGGRE